MKFAKDMKEKIKQKSEKEKRKRINKYRKKAAGPNPA
jgi:hypothetical protein